MGGRVRSAPQNNYPRYDYPRPEYNYRGRYEIQRRSEWDRSIQRGGPYGGGNKLRQMVNEARDRDRDRLDRERERDRMASRATQATQPSRLSDKLGLAPKIERRDLTGPFRGYLDSKALDRNVGGNTPQRRDSQERSRPESPSRSGRSPSSRDTRERSAPTCSTARC